MGKYQYQCQYKREGLVTDLSSDPYLLPQNLKGITR